VSAGRLAHTNILNDINADLRRHVPGNFWKALEAAQRVDENKIMSTVQLLKHVSDAHDKLQAVVEYYAVTEGTSISNQLLTVANSLFQLVLGGVTLSHDLHRHMDNVYEQYVDHLVADITSTMQQADTLYAQVTTRFVNTDDYDDDQLQRLTHQLEAVNSKLMEFDNNLNKTSTHAKTFFPKRLLASKACLDVKKSMNGTIDERLDWLVGFPSSSEFTAATDLRKGSKLRSSLSRMIGCLQAYKTELDKFRLWLDSVTLPKFASSALPTTYVDAVKSDGSKLRNVLLSFVNGSLTKSDLTQMYLTELAKTIQTNANNLVSDVKDSVLTTLKTNVNVFKDVMVTFFTTLFTMYVNLQKYMDSADKGIETRVRQLEIWRKPIINFQSSKVCVCFNCYKTMA